MGDYAVERRYADRQIRNSKLQAQILVSLLIDHCCACCSRHVPLRIRRFGVCCIGFHRLCWERCSTLHDQIDSTQCVPCILYRQHGCWRFRDHGGMGLPCHHTCHLCMQDVCAFASPSHILTSSTRQLMAIINTASHGGYCLAPSKSSRLTTIS